MVYDRPRGDLPKRVGSQIGGAELLAGERQQQLSSRPAVRIGVRPEGERHPDGLVPVDRGQHPDVALAPGSDV